MAKRTNRQLQLERARKKLQIRAKIEGNRELIARKRVEQRKLREDLRAI